MTVMFLMNVLRVGRAVSGHSPGRVGCPQVKGTLSQTLNLKLLPMGVAEQSVGE